jgi:putative aldouronate transport system permease protein
MRAGRATQSSACRDDNEFPNALSETNGGHGQIMARNKQYKDAWGERAFECANIAFLLIAIIVALYPFIHVAMASFSSSSELMRHTGLMLWPRGFSLDGYKMVSRNPLISISYLNTLYYVSAGTAVNMALTTLGAYVLSRKAALLNRFLTMLIIFTMVFSGGIIPLYLQVSNLRMLDTASAMIFPTAINTLYLIIMRTSFESIPEELLESARIDGANDLRVFFNIMLPLSVSTIIVLILYYVVYRWNAWFQASMFMRTRSKFPLQLILREILIATDSMAMTTSIANSGDREAASESIRYAAIMIATVPILCFYPFVQRFFVQGVILGAVKE